MNEHLYCHTTEKKVTQLAEKRKFVANLCESTIPGDYFRIRDFEYVQSLYDLAFLLQINALAEATDVPKYRTFSLWRAGYSLDGYGTTIDRWLDGTAVDADLDYVPSPRIRRYLAKIRKSGSIAELRSYHSERFARCLRLRSVRGLGPIQIALAASSTAGREKWLNQIAKTLSLRIEHIGALYDGPNPGPWQTAHIVPPLLRFLNAMERSHGEMLGWEISGITDPFEPVSGRVTIAVDIVDKTSTHLVAIALREQKLFRRDHRHDGEGLLIRHQLGWSFVVQPKHGQIVGKSISQLATSLDPLASTSRKSLLSDLHLHTAWSDGSASVNTMANAIVNSGLEYFAVTDHSRSCKLQGGLTPTLWLRQANALSLAMPVCPVLHGIEVDILKDGTLDLPNSMLAAADLVVASVHSSWTDDIQTNTDRLLKAIESGCIDIIAHPTSALIGKPGVPDYVRLPAQVNWEMVFEKCARWRVALEFNCFPSRLDLPLSLLAKATVAGCAISIGSDAHARSHILNLMFGEAALRRISAPVVLNHFSYSELKHWVSESRSIRKKEGKSAFAFAQRKFDFAAKVEAPAILLKARIQPPQNIPAGSRVVGIDLTAGTKATGVAVLDEFGVKACSLFTDSEILAYIREHNPSIVSIDSPLGLPGGGNSIDPAAGIVRVAEHDLASIGISAYPALIDSMQKLTLRGIRLRKAIEQFKNPPRVIESYPGAAQDILCIPRKQKSLSLLREGLRRLGLIGAGLETRSHDEMDAITAAIVGRYFESGLFEPMGIPSEAELIVPKVSPLEFNRNPVICLAGKTGAGKSVVSRYLSVFFGFKWIRTRNVIRDLLIEDAATPPSQRLFQQPVDSTSISEKDLREFGAVILNVYKQVPLRKKLTETIEQCSTPVVVDSIRDTVDVNRQMLRDRPVLTWFVDCNDTIIQQRLAKKNKFGAKRIAIGSPVDRTASAIRHESNGIILNSGSLEELRWRIDDALFAIIELESA